jgi:hypothetical protein
MNEGLEIMWEERTVTYFTVLSQHYPGWTEEDHVNLSRALIIK